MIHRRFTGWTGKLVALCLLMGFADVATAEKPDAFPAVDLIAGSEPVYATIAIDPWDDERLAYLLFDGNIDQEYLRVYVWIPGSREFDPPVARRANREREFPTLEFRANSPGAGLTGGRDALMRWDLRYRVRSSGSYFDYARGVMVEREVTRHPYFEYSLGYGTAPRDGTTRTLTRMPLSLLIPGEFRPVRDWADVRSPSRPWTELDFYMQRIAQREGRRAVVRFRARLQHRSHPRHVWRDVTVVSLPPEGKCTLTISPYMQEPIFSEIIPFDVAFGDGHPVDLPFGWYQYDWQLDVPLLEVRPRDDHRVTINPQPLGPFDFE